MKQSNVIAFEFGISYINSTIYTTNSHPISVPSANWELKANATVLNKLICLSVHWDQNNHSNPKKGYLYVNGKEILSFRTNYKRSHNSNTKFYLDQKTKIMENWMEKYYIYMFQPEKLNIKKLF